MLALSAESWAAIGAVSAAVAAIASLIGLVFSKGALDASRETVKLAATTVTDAKASSEAAAQDRRRYRLERIADLVEALFWATEPDHRYTPPTPPDAMQWMDARNRLSQVLAGYRDLIPSA